MARLRFARSTCLLTILLLTSLCFAAPPDRITSPIVSAQTVRLAAGIPMQARPEFDQGPIDPSLQLSYITLLTVPSAAQQKAVDRLLVQQQNPHSPYYHKWLTPEQYADRFGLSQNDMNKLTNWLWSQGFTVKRTARGRNWIVFSGTAALVEKVFQTEIHQFRVNGEEHFANVTQPSIPAALAGVVSGFRGLNNFRPKSRAQQGHPEYTFNYKNNSFFFLAPGDISAIYDINSLYSAGIDGAGQKLAVMGQTGIYQSDLSDFRTAFGLSAISCTTSGDIITSCNSSNFQYVLVNGSATTVYGDLPEADIDIQWSGATAPNAQIIFVNSTDPNGFGVWDSWYYAVDNNVAPVITMSYGAPCELAEASFGTTGEGTFSSDEAELAQANSEGITFMNSSGDTGAAECDYGSNFAVYGYAAAYPASSQYVTAVGGTSIPGINPNEYSQTYWNPTNGSDGGSAIGYIPEQPWNDAQEFGLICSQNSPPGFCGANGIADWQTAQNAIGISAGGGAISNCSVVDANFVCQAGFPVPTWQSSINASAINPNSVGAVAPGRYTPDVSLLASPNFPGYLVCTQQSALGGTGSGSTCSGGISGMLNACLAGTAPCSIFGGTSVSSPVFAGIVTLLNQYLNGNGSPGLGNINPTLYLLAASNSANHAFNSITTGSTGSYSDGAWCSQGTPTGPPGDPWPAALQCPSSGPNPGFLGFNAYDADPTTGYNLVAGLGSVDAGNLAIAWAGAASNFTFTPNSQGQTQTVLAGLTTGTYSFTATPASGTTFAAPVFFTCSFVQPDPTLTSSSCTFSPAFIPAGAAATLVNMTIATVGPNTGPVRPGQTHRASQHNPWLPLSLPIAGILLAGFAGRRVSKYSVVAGLCVSVALLGLLAACGGGGGNSAPPPISVSVSQGTPASLYPNDSADNWPSQTATFTANVNNDGSNKGVTWAVSTANGGTIQSADTFHATYTAPTVASGLPTSVTITATSVADPSKSNSAQETLKAATVPGTYTVNVAASSGGTQLPAVPVTLIVQ
jgi:subtilase family serine protease